MPQTTEEMSAQFPQFVSRIDVIEKASGFTFSVPDALKAGGGQTWWLERKGPGNWSPRSQSCPDDAKPDGGRRSSPSLSASRRVRAND